MVQTTSWKLSVALQVVPSNDPSDCILFQAKIVEPPSAAYEATHKKQKTINQPKQVYENFPKPVLGGWIKPLLKGTNHAVPRN